MPHLSEAVIGRRITAVSVLRSMFKYKLFRKCIKYKCIGADTGGDEGDRSPHFYSSIVSFAVSEWIIPPRAKQFFRLAALAIIILPLANLSRRPCTRASRSSDRWNFQRAAWAELSIPTIPVNIVSVEESYTRFTGAIMKAAKQFHPTGLPPHLHSMSG
jgi:hypothetical protein